MKKFLIHFLTFLNFVAISCIGQTVPSRTTSGDIIRREINNKYVNGLTKQYTISQLRGINPTLSDSSQIYYLTSSEKEGNFKLDISDDSTADNGGTCIRTKNGLRLKRIIQDNIYSEWFEGTDLQKIQKAINYLIANKGGTLKLLAKTYNLDGGTIYINPTSEIPISIQGSTLNIRDEEDGSGNKGTTITRTSAGDIFRVNLDSNGASVLPTSQQYFGFSIQDINFSGKNGSVGINAIKTFRTRAIYKALSANRIDYLVIQPDTDINGASNYCDHSVFEAIRVVQSRLGGLKLSYTDGSIINGFYFENPNLTCTNGIEIFAGSGTVIKGVVLGLSLNHQINANSSFIKLRSCSSISLVGLHLESSKFENLFEVFYSNAITFESCHIRFYYNNLLKTTNSNYVTLRNFDIWANIQSSYSDIKILGSDAESKVVTTENFLIGSYPDKTQRTLSYSNEVLNSYKYDNEKTVITGYVNSLSNYAYSEFVNQRMRATTDYSWLTGYRSKPLFYANGKTGVISSSFLAEDSPYIFKGDSGDAYQIRANDGVLKYRVSSSGNVVANKYYNIAAINNFDMSTNSMVYYAAGIQRFKIFTTGEVLVGDDSLSSSTTEKLQVKGDLRFTLLGAKIKFTTGTNSSLNSATLIAGTVTINANIITANSIVLITGQNCNSCGSYYVSSKTAGTGFTITSTNASDTSTVGYLIIN